MCQQFGCQNFRCQIFLSFFIWSIETKKSLIAIGTFIPNFLCKKSFLHKFRLQQKVCLQIWDSKYLVEWFIFYSLQTWADPIKLFFLRFQIFSVKLGHFTINDFFPTCNKHASLPVKNGKILRCEEKKFYRFGYWIDNPILSCCSWYSSKVFKV